MPTVHLIAQIIKKLCEYNCSLACRLDKNLQYKRYQVTKKTRFCTRENSRLQMWKVLLNQLGAQIHKHAAMDQVLISGHIQVQTLCKQLTNKLITLTYVRLDDP